MWKSGNRNGTSHRASRPSPREVINRVLSYSALVFDLDGTLVDSSRDLAAAVNNLLGEEGLAPLALPQVLTMIGDGAASLVARAFARYDRDAPTDGLERYRAHYRRNCLDRTWMYPGIRQLLECLGDRRPRPAMAVATNKPQEFAERLVESLGLAPFFDAVVGPEVVTRRKPAPDHVLETLERLGHEPCDAVMIGDSHTDILSGKRAGAVSIAVLWGVRSRDQLEELEPDYFVASVGELSELLGC